jgi:hypothetical protein
MHVALFVSGAQSLDRAVTVCARDSHGRMDRRTAYERRTEQRQKASSVKEGSWVLQPLMYAG